MFNQFIQQLKSSLQKELPGEKAQFKMAPLGRMNKQELITKYGVPIPSAVMILFYPVNDQPHFVLTVRNTYPGAHSGQVSFPGGRKDEADESLLFTALRETEEEIGVSKNQLEVIGALTDLYIPVSKFMVHSFVVFANERPEFKPDVREVVELLEVPVALILEDSTVKEKEIFIELRNSKIQAPYFDIFGHTVWGATAMMLSELKQVLLKMK